METKINYLFFFSDMTKHSGPVFYTCNAVMVMKKCGLREIGNGRCKSDRYIFTDRAITTATTKH